MQAKNCSCSSALEVLVWSFLSCGGDEELGKLFVILFGSQGNGSDDDSGGASSSSSFCRGAEIICRLLSLRRIDDATIAAQGSHDGCVVVDMEVSAWCFVL